MKTVSIEWIDSTGASGWAKRDTVELGYTCATYGILVKETDDIVTVATTYDSYTDAYHGVLAIPKVAIRKLEHFGED